MLPALSRRLGRSKETVLSQMKSGSLSIRGLSKSTNFGIALCLLSINIIHQKFFYRKESDFARQFIMFIAGYQVFSPSAGLLYLKVQFQSWRGGGTGIGNRGRRRGMVMGNNNYSFLGGTFPPVFPTAKKSRETRPFTAET